MAVVSFGIMEDVGTHMLDLFSSVKSASLSNVGGPIIVHCRYADTTP